MKLFLLLLAACSAWTTARAAERIVCLGGAVTETVFALGAGGEVVARDSSSLFPPAARGLPDVGYFRTIGAEGVLAQKPTLVLAAQGAGPASQVEILKNSSVAFVQLDAGHSAEAVLANITRLGAALRREAAASALAEKLRAQLAAARCRGEAGADGRPVRAVFLLNVDAAATQAAYEGTAADALLKLCGAENPLTGLTGYKPLNAEALLAIDPDVIFYGANPSAPRSETPAWIRTTRAGRTGRVHRLDLGYHLSFGPRLGEAVMEVAALLRPATR